MEMPILMSFFPRFLCHYPIYQRAHDHFLVLLSNIKRTARKWMNVAVEGKRETNEMDMPVAFCASG